MARVKTYGNGPGAGTFLPSQLNTIQDDYEKSFSTYKTLVERIGNTSGTGGAPGGIYLLPAGGTIVAASGAGSPWTSGYVQTFYFDPADLDVGAPNARATKLRLRAAVLTNGSLTHAAASFTIGLYPVSAVTGTVGDIGLTVTTPVGTAGVLAPQPTGARAVQLGADFAAPAAGHYVLGFLLANTTGPNSAFQVQASLQARQV